MQKEAAVAELEMLSGNGVTTGIVRGYINSLCSKHTHFLWSMPQATGSFGNM
jgi:hypothetical protein